MAKDSLVAHIIKCQNGYGGDNPPSNSSEFALHNLPFESLVQLSEQWKLKLCTMTPIESIKTGIYGAIKSIEALNYVPWAYAMFTNTERDDLPDVIRMLEYVSVTEPINIIENMRKDAEFQNALNEVLKKYGDNISPYMTPEVQLMLSSVRIIGLGVMHNAAENAKRDGFIAKKNKIQPNYGSDNESEHGFVR